MMMGLRSEVNPHMVTDDRLERFLPDKEGGRESGDDYDVSYHGPPLLLSHLSQTDRNYPSHGEIKYQL